DFVAEVISGFEAADGAILVTDATGGGVEAGLEQAVSLGRSTGTAACFFINKCDKENADPLRALDALRAVFGNKIAPLQLAIGAALPCWSVARRRASACRRCSTRSSATSPPPRTRAPQRPSTRAGRPSRSIRTRAGRSSRACSRPRPTRSSAA